jgi:hypothetical protein
VYSTCLFCNADLGRNEAIETFPVGRRLAFDAAKGRLWVVCRACERWNLTPLEERWEAIEACERAFRETRLRVSTDEIGLARLREGLELVRIGAPQRPEMAAWRYGDQFGRRRKRALLIGSGIAVATAGYVIAGPVMGLLTTVGLGGTGVLNVISLGRAVYRAQTIAARIPVHDGQTLDVQGDHLERACLSWGLADGRWSLDVTHRPAARGSARSWRLAPNRATTTFTGDEALAAARLLLPGVNARGAGKGAVQDAVDYLERSSDPEQLFARTARHHSTEGALRHRSVVLHKLPLAIRLALEMSAHEETERRALEGELHLLESSWREAEEIAGIADDMFLPASVDEELARLKRLRDGGGADR